MKTVRSSLLLLLALLLAATPVFGAARYRLTEIVLPPEAIFNQLSGSKFADLNNQGVVAGWYRIEGTSFDCEAYRWEKGVRTGLPHLLGDGTYVTRAHAINNLGQMAGMTISSTSGVAPCLWEGVSPFTPASLPEGGRAANALNDLGQAVGVAGEGGSQAVLWKDGARTTLPTLAASTESNAFGINKDGFIAGYCQLYSYGPNFPVLWQVDGGVITIKNLNDFGEKPGFTERGGVAYAINDFNQVVGYAHSPLGDFGSWRAFFWENDNLTDLGALQTNGSSYARDINNAGQIVGYSYSTNPYGDHAVLWEKGAIIDLNTRINPIPNWFLREAQGINDRGQIVCLAESYDGLNNRIYLLTPVSSLAPTYNLLLHD